MALEGILERLEKVTARLEAVETKGGVPRGSAPVAAAAGAGEVEDGNKDAGE